MMAATLIERAGSPLNSLARHHAKTVRLRNRRLAWATQACIQQLEARQLLAASVYVGENLVTDFTITNDTAPPGLSNGDTVTWNPSGTQHPQGAVAGLTFGVDAFDSVANGIAAADVGGTVYVEAGTYPDNTILNKRLTLSGAKFGLDARGRVTGVPNPASEAVLTAATGSVLTLTTGCAGSVINGFSIFGGTRGVESTSGPLDGLQLRNNDFRGSTNSEVFLNDNGQDITINQNSFDGASATGNADLFHLDTDNFAGLFFLDNWVRNRTGGTGFFVDGVHNVGPSATRAPLISGNLIDSNATGMNLGTRAFGSLTIANAGTISGNTFSNSGFDGLQGGMQHALITRNTFTGNARYGLALTSFGNIGADRGAQNTLISENFFSGNATDDLFFSSTQAAGTISTNVAFDNSFGSATAVSYAGAETIEVGGNWWGSATGPSVANHPSGTGNAIVGLGAGNIDFTPWLNSGTDSASVTPGFQGDLSYLHVDDDSPQAGAVTRIQEGINVVADGSLVGGARLVFVEPGAYNESNIAVNKAVTVRGQSQAGVVVGPSIADSHDNSTFGGTVSNGFLVQASDVTIETLTLDGNADGAIPGDHNFRAGVITDSTLPAMKNNLTVQNVTVQHVYRRGIQVFSGGTVKSSGHLLDHNTVNDVTLGPGIALFDAAGTVSFNDVSGVASAIESVEFSTTGGTTVHINDNTVHGLGADATGIQVVVPAAGTTLNNNHITLSGGSDDVGIIVRNASGAVTVSGNDITGSAGDAGIWMFGNSTPVVVTNNVLSTSSSTSPSAGFGAGIFVSDDGSIFTNGDGDPVTNLPGSANLTGNSISGFAVGIDVASTGAAAQSGPQSVSVTFGAGNSIVGGSSGTGLRVDGVNATIGGDTLDSLAFSGFTGTSQFIVLANGAYGPNGEIDGTGASYNGVTGGASLTDAQGYAIEDRITHRLDAAGAGTGLVRIRAGHVYVTTNSGSIQRGVDAADSGDTVNVQGGTYAESVTINKAVTIDGEGDGPTPQVNWTSDSSNALARVTSTNAVDDVTIRDIAFDGINGANHAGYAVQVTAPANFDTLTLERSTFTNANFDALEIDGDATNGLSAHNVVLSDLSFTNNGADGGGGSGDISLFQYNGNASFTNLTLVGSAVGNTGARLGIQFRGVGAGTGATEKPMGTVSLNNVDISGNYRTSFLGIQRYSTLTGLSMTDVALGGATSNITGTFGDLLRFDAAGSGSVSSPATVNLGSTHFRGVSPTSPQQAYLEFAPDNSFAFLRADATNAVWDLPSGTNLFASGMTAAQAYDAEDRILDYEKILPAGATFKGWAELQDGQAFVTNTAAGPISGDSITRAAQVVDSGGTVNIKAGTYVENVTIDRPVTIDGEGSGPSPLVTLTASSSGGSLLRITSTNASDDVTVRDIAFEGLNGTNQANEAIRTDAPANFDMLTVDRSTFNRLQSDAISVNGDALNGISARSVVISNSSFTNNGTEGGGGAGDISIFQYNGNATLTNLTLVGSAVGNTGARLGIQFRGVGDGAGNALLPMGTIALNNVDISGNYRTSFLGIQRYSTLTGLSLTDVALGGSTSNITGTFGALLRFDAAGSGSVSFPATVDLGNTHFRGVSGSSAQPTYLEFAPDNTFAFLDADATSTRWDLPVGGANLTASAMTVTQAYEAEDRIFDYPKNLPSNGSFKGWAELQNGQAFVTDTAAGPISGDSITRAAQVVDSGGTVHIKSGTYTQDVETSTNAVTLSPGSSPGSVTINGNVTLDANDALAMEIDGFTPGTQHDQFIINGTVTLGGATLDTSGSAITATQGQSLTLIVNDASEAVGGFFAAPANGNGNVVLVDGQPFYVLYTGGDGNDVTLTRAPDGTPIGAQPAPNIVFVDDDWSSNSFGQDADGPTGASLGNGTAKGIDQFDNIQDAINAVAPGGAIRIYGGTYVQNPVVNKSLHLLGQDFIQAGTAGDGNNDVIIDPAATVTNVLEINASNVEVAGIVIDGDTTDSRGILATHATDTLSGLDIHHNLVRNLFRRGIQTDTYLASFDIHDNVVMNIMGDPEAIGIFNFGGGGGAAGTAEIHNNLVSGCTVGIAGQQSAGMHVFDNTITMVAGGVGIQDSNPGTGAPPPSGATESFVNNTISGGDSGAYGLIVINSAMDVLIQDNKVTTPGVGLGTYGHFGATVPTTTFDGNTVAADTTGIEVSTDTFGFNGIQDVNAVITGNDVSGSSGAGILVKDTDGAGGAIASANISNNTTSIRNNFVGIDVNGGVATIDTNDIHDNTTGIRVRNGGRATISSNQFNGNGIGLVVEGGSATITNTQRIDGVGIATGGLLTLAAGTNTVLITPSLTITGSGTLDLRDNTAIIDYTGASPVASIFARLASGYEGGAWNGSGIMSTDAANEPNHRTAVGYAQATDLFGTFPATFAGQSIDSTSLLLRYTLYGDANLDQKVDVSDLGILATSWQQSPRRWSQGDFNFDQHVDVSDLGVLATNWQGSLPMPSLSSVLPLMAPRPVRLGTIVAPADMIGLRGD